MASRSLDDCIPKLKEKALLLRKKAEEVGIRFIITCTARSKAEQEALYAQGRQPLVMVNQLRAMAGLEPIMQYENEHKVTWTLNSKHITNEKNLQSRAIDENAEPPRSRGTDLDRGPPARHPNRWRARQQR